MESGTAQEFRIGFYRGPGLLAGRLVIPIHNERGELVAYCGRALDGALPRYRFPGGFAKSEVLFNFHRAAACGKPAVIVLGHVYGRAGEKAKALRILNELTTMSKQRYVSPMDFAVVFAGLGDADSTFQWLENAYETRASRVHELPWMYFDGVRSDPRYSDS